MKKTTKTQLIDAHRHAIRRLEQLHNQESEIYSQLNVAIKNAGNLRLHECVCGEDNNQHKPGCPRAINR